MDQAPASKQTRERRMHYALLICLPLLVFANSLQGAYHLDDIYRVVNNAEIERLSPMWRHFVDPYTSATLPQLVQYRPMLPLSLSINLALGDALGLDRILSFHLGNVAIHIVCILLWYALFRELLERWSGMQLESVRTGRIAFVAAACCAVHPVAGVSVNYICGRDLLLMLAFLLAALLVHLRWRRSGNARLRVPLFCLLLFCSLASKGNALAAPLVVLLFEVTLGGVSLRSKAAWVRALPALGCVVAFTAGTRLLLDFSDAGNLIVQHESWLTYPATELGLHLSYYLRNVLWPFRMRAEAFIEPTSSLLAPWTLLGGTLVLLSLYCAWRTRRSRPLIACCITGYWVLMALTSSIVPMRRFATDYRQIPALGFLMLLGALLGAQIPGPRARLALALTVLGWFAGTSVYMNRHWATEESFWLQSVRHGGSALAHMNYGLSVAERDPDLAEKHYLKTLEMYPGHVYGHINLGLLRIGRGQTEEGLGLVRRAVEIRSDWALAHYWLAIACERAGQSAEGAQAASRAIELDGRNVQYLEQAKRSLYAAALEAQEEQRFTESLAHLEHLHALQPGYGESLFLKGYALQRGARLPAAIEAYTAFLATHDAHSQAHFNLGFALMQSQRWAQAVVHLQRTLAIDPEYVAAHQHLATCYGQMGDEVRRLEHSARARR